MIDGLLVIDKPRGLTSFDVVARVKRLFHQRRVGHAGTLDPDVDGVLVIALGKATKLIDELQTRPKCYTGEITLGFATTTEDAEGECVADCPPNQPYTAEQIDAALTVLTGQITQTPPIYSAIKVNGRRLYDYARKGESVAIPSRTVTVYDFQRLTLPLSIPPYQKFAFTATVSKGTYIRSLATDVGRQLAIPATMTRLTRVSGSGFDRAQAIPLAELEQQTAAAQQAAVQPLATVLDWPVKSLTDDEWFAVRNGQKISTWKPATHPWQLFYRGSLKSVYVFDTADSCWRSRYVFDNTDDHDTKNN